MCAAGYGAAGKVSSLAALPPAMRRFQRGECPTPFWPVPGAVGLLPCIGGTWRNLSVAAAIHLEEAALILGGDDACACLLGF